MAAEVTKQIGSGGAGGVKVDRAQARAVSRAKKTGGHVMLEDERYCLQLVRNAAKACRIASDRIQRGDPVSAEVMQACATLSAETSKVMFA